MDGKYVAWLVDGRRIDVADAVLTQSGKPQKGGSGTMTEKSTLLTDDEIETLATCVWGGAPGMSPSVGAFARKIEAAVIAKLEPATRERERVAWNVALSCHQDLDWRVLTGEDCNAARDRLYPSLTPPPVVDEGVTLSDGHRYRIIIVSGGQWWEIAGRDGSWSGMTSGPHVATAADADKLADYLRGRGGHP